MCCFSFPCWCHQTIQKISKSQRFVVVYLHKPLGKTRSCCWGDLFNSNGYHPEPTHRLQWWITLCLCHRWQCPGDQWNEPILLESRCWLLVSSCVRKIGCLFYISWFFILFCESFWMTAWMQSVFLNEQVQVRHVRFMNLDTTSTTHSELSNDSNDSALRVIRDLRWCDSVDILDLRRDILDESWKF